MKIYGNDKTNLVLSDKAFEVYSNTDPLKIIEEDDGTYSMTGCIERHGMTEDDVNTVLEEFGSLTWYAVLRDEDDNDWGTGSYDYDEAVEMAKQYGDDARIAVIDDGDDPVCLRVIMADEF